MFKKVQKLFKNLPGFVQFLAGVVTTIILGLLANAVFALYTSRRLQQVVSQRMPATPIASTYISAWSTYQVLGLDHRPLFKITYKLPPNVEPLYCANAGCYYRQTLMPGRSTLAIIPIGIGQGWNLSWGKTLNQILSTNNFTQRIIMFAGLPGTIELSGQLSTASSTDLNLLDEGYGPFRAVLVRLNENLSLEIIHYQSRFTPGQVDFASDERLFDQILSTFELMD